MSILAWRRTGPATECPLVLLHAMPLDGSMWDAMRSLMPEVDVLSVDAPGFGDSPDGYVLAEQYPHPELGDEGAASVAVYVDALAATLASLGITSAVLAGNSMGGAVAAAFALKHQQMVQGLAIMDSKIGPEPAEGRASRQHIIAMCEAGRAYDTVRDWTHTLLSPAAREELRSALDSEFRAVPDAGLAWLQRAQLNRGDYRQALAAITGPVLLVRGADDPTCPRSLLEEYRSVNPAARIIEIMHAGHFTPVEQPKACAQLLADMWHQATEPA